MSGAAPSWTQVPPRPSLSLPTIHSWAHLDTFIVALYEPHCILSRFEREGSLVWASLFGCGRLREGNQKWRRGIRRSASGSANKGTLPITSTTLNIGVKILQILPSMAKVCYSLLFNRSLCMGLKLALVVFSFQLGRICVFRAYTNLLVACIRFGRTMSTAGYG